MSSSNFEDMTEQLGEGGAGKVVLAVHKIDRQSYAIKIIRFHEAAKSEVFLMAQMNHMNVVKYHTSWLGEYDFSVWDYVIEDSENSNLSADSESDDLKDKVPALSSDDTEEKVPALFSDDTKQKVPALFIQMELCEGTLEDLLDEPELMSREEATRIFRQILEGLNHVHTLGIRHGDISPSNIFYKGSDFKLADFDHSTQPAEGEVYGAKVPFSDFVPPELGVEVVTGRYTRASDVYSLGMVYLEMVVKETERHEARDMMKNGKVHESLRDCPDVAKIILDMTHTNPSRRSSVTEILSAQ